MRFSLDITSDIIIHNTSYPEIPIFLMMVELSDDSRDYHWIHFKALKALKCNHFLKRI